MVAALAAKGIPMAIATSSRSKAVEKKRKRCVCDATMACCGFDADLSMLTTLLVRHDAIFQHMSTIVCGDDPELKNGKPAPDIYLLAAERLGVDPQECLVVEDAMVSCRMLRNGLVVLTQPPTPPTHAFNCKNHLSRVFVVEKQLVVLWSQYQTLDSPTKRKKSFGQSLMWSWMT